MSLLCMYITMYTHIQYTDSTQARPLQEEPSLHSPSGDVAVQSVDLFIYACMK